MKKLIIVIIALIFLAAGLYFWLQMPVASPYGSKVPTQTAVPNPAPAKPSDTTNAINEELNRVDLGNLDKEFEGVDRDLGGL